MTSSNTNTQFFDFPQQWRFVPIAKGGKAPIGEGWQQKPMVWSKARKLFGKTYLNRPVGAIGCLAGEISGGLLFADCDGESGYELLKSWGELPSTWCVTSGRKGRQQFVFWVPEGFWPQIETAKFKTGVKSIDENGKEFEEGLELRWNGMQSLVFGINPVSNLAYQWSGTDTQIADAPLHIIEKMLITEKAKGSVQANWREFDRSFQLPCEYTIPLEICLRREDRELIERGADGGSRNDSGFKLAANLLATADYLEDIGQRFDGVPEQLFERYCLSCAGGNGWTQREWDQTWRSAEKRGRSPAVPPDGMEAAAKAWVWKNCVKGTLNEKSGRVSNPSNHASKGGVKPLNVYGAGTVELSEQNSKVDLQADIEEGLKEFFELNQRRRHRLNLAEVLPLQLARDLQQTAEVMPAAPEMLLTAFLPMVASLVGTSANIFIDLGYEWIEPIVLWTMGVGESGTMKSPAFDVLFKPIKKLQRMADRRYSRDKEQWESVKRASEANKQPFDDPEPVPREYWVDDITIESLAKVHQENPKGLLVFRDEIDGFYAALNKYRSGGDDEQKWLSLNAGRGIKVNRLSKRHSLHRTAIPITGTIQPETIADHLRGRKRTNSGMNARWLYCLTDMPAPYATGKKADPRMADRLFSLYKRLESLQPDIQTVEEEDGASYTVSEPYLYRFAPDALIHFRDKWNNPMVARWERETHPGVKKALSKYRGYCARIALILHLAEWAASTEANPLIEISLDTLKRAIKITEFFVSQIYVAYGIAGEWEAESSDTNWSALIARLREASEASEDGWITPRIACRKTSLLKSSSHARSVFAQLFESGIGELDTGGKIPRWKWKECSDSTTNLDIPTFLPSTGDLDSPSDISDTLTEQSYEHSTNTARPTASPFAEQSRELRTDQPPPGAGVSTNGYQVAAEPRAAQPARDTREPREVEYAEATATTAAIPTATNGHSTANQPTIPNQHSEATAQPSTEQIRPAEDRDLTDWPSIPAVFDYETQQWSKIVNWEYSDNGKILYWLNGLVNDNREASQIGIPFS